MIVRQWIGETRESDADIYGKYLEETGISEIRATKGNRDVWLLRRVHDGKAEFIVLSLWDSFEAIKAFAGPEYEKARYYAEDKRFLLRLDPHVTHYEVLVGSVR
jgi:heme-degrading monooxygenase HmoA